MYAKFNNTKVTAIAACVPLNEFDMRSYADIFGTSEVERIIQSTGIEKVRRSTPTVTATDLCYHAAQEILKKNNLSAKEIDALIYVTSTPDYASCYGASILQSRLSIPNSSLLFDLAQSFNGYIYGLLQGHMLLESGCAKNVLLCVGETLSKALNTYDNTTCMHFGDAGSATLLEKSEDTNTAHFLLRSNGEKSNLLSIECGIRNPNGPLILQMDETEILKFVIDKIPTLISNLLEITNTPIKSVNLFIFHQANLTIQKFFETQIGIDHTQLRASHLKLFGNVGAASIPLTICNSKNNALECSLFCSYGAGLSLGCAKLNLKNLKTFPILEI